MVADNDLLTHCASFAVLGGTKLALKGQQLSPRPWSATRHSENSSKSLLSCVMVANVIRYRRGSGIRGGGSGLRFADCLCFFRSVDENEIGDEGAAALATSLERNQTLRELR